MVSTIASSPISLADPFASSSPFSTPSSNEKMGRKERRKIIPYKQNLSPSTDSTSTGPDSIRQHAFMRIQIFYCICIGLFETSCRTDPSQTKSPKLRVGRAYMQVGKGHRKK